MKADTLTLHAQLPNCLVAYEVLRKPAQTVVNNTCAMHWKLIDRHCGVWSYETALSLLYIEIPHQQLNCTCAMYD